MFYTCGNMNDVSFGSLQSFVIGFINGTAFDKNCHLFTGNFVRGKRYAFLNKYF